MSTNSGDGWAGHVTGMRDVPWLPEVDHRAGVKIARSIATDLITHRRWLAGEQLVYRVTDGGPLGGGGVRYVGDDSDDTVRCQSGDDLIRLWLGDRHWRSVTSGLEQSDKDVDELAKTIAEPVYRQMYGAKMRLAADLRDTLTAAIEAGQVEKDQAILTVVARLMAHGYSVDDLRVELGESD